MPEEKEQNNTMMYVAAGAGVVAAAGVAYWALSKRSTQGEEEFFQQVPAKPTPRPSTAAAPAAQPSAAPSAPVAQKARDVPAATPAAASELEGLADDLMTESTEPLGDGEAKDWSKIGLKAVLPAGWSVATGMEGEEGGEITNMSLKSSAIQLRHASFPANPTVPLNVTLVAEDERLDPPTIEGLADKTQKAAEQEMPPMMPMKLPKPRFSRRETVTGKGVWSYLLDHNQQIPLPPDMQLHNLTVRTYLALNEGVAYMIQLLSGDAEFPKYEKLFEELIPCVQFTPFSTQYSSSAMGYSKEAQISLRLPAHTAPTSKGGKPITGFSSVLRARTCAETRQDLIDVKKAAAPEDDVAVQYNKVVQGEITTDGDVKVISYTAARKTCIAAVGPSGFVVDVSPASGDNGVTLTTQEVAQMAASIKTEEVANEGVLHQCDMLGIGFTVLTDAAVQDTGMSLTTMYFPDGHEDEAKHFNISIREIPDDGTRPDGLEGWRKSMDKEDPKPSSTATYTIAGLQAFGFVQEQPLSPEMQFQMMMQGANVEDRPCMENVVLFMDNNRQLAIQCETTVKDFKDCSTRFKDFMETVFLL